jgi:hypothetical protein
MLQVHVVPPKKATQHEAKLEMEHSALSTCGIVQMLCMSLCMNMSICAMPFLYLPIIHI